MPLVLIAPLSKFPATATNISPPYATEFQALDAGIALVTQFIPSRELAATALFVRIATNLLLPPAIHFQSPAVGMLNAVHSTPSELYSAALPPEDTATNLPAAASLSSPVPYVFCTADMIEFVLSLLTAVIKIVKSFTGVSPPSSSPGIINSCPNSYPAPPSTIEIV